jgi:hypothetical protein
MAHFALSRALRGAVVGLALAAVAGCASGPQPAAAPQGAAQVQAAAQQAGTTTQHLTDVQKLVVKARQEGLPGFYAIVRGGQEMYCWRDKDIGSLIPSTKCVTSASQLRQVLAQLAEERHRMQEAPGGICAQSGNCAGN